MGGIAVARKLRYGVYDTSRKVWLYQMEMPVDGIGAAVTTWTREADKAMRFPGIKSAMAMVRKLGSYSQFVVKNEKGDIVA